METVKLSKDAKTIINDTFNNCINDFRFLIKDNGYAILNPAWICKDSVSPYNRLYLIDRGEGILETENQRITMVPGMVYLIPPELRVSYRCPEELRKLYFHITVLKPDHYDLFRDCRIIRQIPLPAQQLQKIISLYNSNSYAGLLQIKQQLYELICAFQEVYGVGLNAFSYTSYVADAIKYIQDNLSAKLSLAELADHCHISKNFLSDTFRQEVGVTIGKYIDDCLMAVARERLCQCNLSIADISAELGFCDQFYFSRRFKQLCGMTPTQYRNKAKL